jgi:hypothetical protein
MLLVSVGMMLFFLLQFSSVIGMCCWWFTDPFTFLVAPISFSYCLFTLVFLDSLAIEVEVSFEVALSNVVRLVVLAAAAAAAAAAASRAVKRRPAAAVLWLVLLLLLLVDRTPVGDVGHRLAGRQVKGRGRKPHAVRGGRGEAGIHAAAAARRRQRVGRRHRRARRGAASGRAVMMLAVGGGFTQRGPSRRPRSDRELQRLWSLHLSGHGRRRRGCRLRVRIVSAELARRRRRQVRRQRRIASASARRRGSRAPRLISPSTAAAATAGSSVGLVPGQKAVDGVGVRRRTRRGASVSEPRPSKKGIREFQKGRSSKKVFRAVKLIKGMGSSTSSQSSYPTLPRSRGESLRLRPASVCSRYSKLSPRLLLTRARLSC